MTLPRLLLVAITPLVAFAESAAADPPDDQLKGRFAFNWHSNPDRQKCRAVEGKLLGDLKSAQYKCDLKPVSNTASGNKAVVCTQAKGKAEYLIFATMRACEDERKTQASNG